MASDKGYIPELNFEEQELLLDFLQSDSYPVFMKLIEACHQPQIEAVLRYNLADGSDGLVITKARAEGSERLLSRIQKLRQMALKSRSKDE